MFILYLTFQAGQREHETVVFTHQVGNSQSSERKHVTRCFYGSQAVLADLVSQQVGINCSLLSGLLTFAHLISATCCLSIICVFRPHIKSLCRREQAILWLQAEEEETKEEVTSVSPQQVNLTKAYACIVLKIYI